MVRKNKDPSGMDRISELPEPLIHLILSFLPTECVVSMSVLSKRWRYIWTSVPVIDLRGLKYVTSPPLEDPNEEHERSKIYPVQLQRIINFVYKKLSLHHETRDIKKFYLDCCNVFDPSERLEEWVSALFTRHNLEEFVVCRDLSEVLMGIGIFPSFGTCASLVNLELDIWDEVDLPDAINFPNLKICRIRNAELQVYSEDPAQRFFSNLPVLEELELTNCSWDIADILLISAPALKYLSITGPNERTEFDDSPFYEFKIKILAPNLLSFRYADVPPEDFILHRFESLVDADIDFERFERPLPQGEDPIATKVLNKLSNVKRLEISGETFEELLLPDGLLTNLPMFHNLVYLKVTSKITFSKDTTLFNFLRISPNLVRIHIAQGYVKHLPSTDSGSRPDMVPQCMLLHLKLVKFCLFDGNLEELNAVKTFLKNARVLQRMIVKFRSCISTVRQNNVMKKLLKFPRGPDICTIEVS